MHLWAFAETFAVNRKLTYDLLEQLTEDELRRSWPRPGLDTFAKHFQEMAAVQTAFVNALSSADMDFSNVPGVFSFADEAKEALRKQLHDADALLATTLNGKQIAATVNWEGMHLPVDQHFTNLISHEVFHQGMMTMVLYQFGLPIPASWITSWALPPSAAKEQET